MAAPKSIAFDFFASIQALSLLSNDSSAAEFEAIWIPILEKSRNVNSLTVDLERMGNPVDRLWARICRLKKLVHIIFRCAQNSEACRPKCSVSPRSHSQ